MLANSCCGVGHILFAHGHQTKRTEGIVVPSTMVSTQALLTWWARWASRIPDCAAMLRHFLAHTLVGHTELRIRLGVCADSEVALSMVDCRVDIQSVLSHGAFKTAPQKTRTSLSQCLRRSCDLTEIMTDMGSMFWV